MIEASLQSLIVPRTTRLASTDSESDYTDSADITAIGGLRLSGDDVNGGRALPDRYTQRPMRWITGDVKRADSA
jgi:hypothetical protein